VKIQPEQYLPTWFMVQYVACAVWYVVREKPWMGFYWLLATGLTYIVTFKLK